MTEPTPAKPAPALPELPLFVWLSPGFPVGAFAYSHGLEWAVECGDVTDAATLREWLTDLFGFGSVRNDCILLAESFRAVMARDAARLEDANALAIALSASQERHLETVAQGNAFAAAMRDVWPCDMLQRLSEGVDDIAYPVALGAAIAGHNLPLASSLETYGLAFASNLVSAALRLGAIGQTDGQRVLAALIPQIRECAQFATQSTPDDLGGATLRSDIASMKHETQYSRLFRS
jgi:urease accessory protein